MTTMFLGLIICDILFLLLGIVGVVVATSLERRIERLEARTAELER